MKTLIFSDTHLTHAFDPAQYDFLKKIISESDRVIINGDFWDGYLTTFDAFTSSPWKKLFPLLRRKQTIYVYGNHDRKRYADERVGLFSVKQTNRVVLKTPRFTYLVEHGNKASPGADAQFRLSRRLLRPLTAIGHKIESFITRNHLSPLHFWGSMLNIIIKSRKRSADTFYVCGHTHFAELDTPRRFGNTGFVLYGLGQYLLLDGKGRLTLHTEWYR